MRPVFIKHFLRGSVKCLPYLGNLLDEIIFGVLDAESAEAESQKIHEKLHKIITDRDQQEADLAEILLALHIQTDVNEQIQERLKEVEQSLRDDTDSPFPEYFANALDKVIGGNKKIHAELQKLADQHKQQSLEHKRIEKKVDGIEGNVKEIIEKVDLVNDTATTIKDHAKVGSIGNGGTVVEGNHITHIHKGIDENSALNQLVGVSKQLGQSEERNKNQQETIKQLEEQLSQPHIMADPAAQQVPQPTQEAKDLAAQIEDDAGPYALALKAIAIGNTEQADELLDETQQFLDAVQEQKDRAQAKIYMARIQNASYAGRPQDALQYCNKLKPLAGNDSLIINEMAVAYYENAKYKEAELLMQRAQTIDEASLGKDHPNVAIRLNNLAMLYQDTNRLKEAEPLIKRALEIGEASLGKNLPNVAIRLNNLAQLYQATNRLKEAEPLMKRALRIDEASLGKDHPKVALRLNNLAMLYKATNRPKDAELLIQRALKIDEASSGKDHPDVAITLNNLAALYQATNRLKEAEPLAKCALKIVETSLGKGHPKVAITLNNLAQLYQATNRLKEAEPLMQRALKIDEASFGKNHPKVALRLNNLALLYHDTNRLKQAEPLMKRALKIDEASLGKDHPNVATDLNNLAGLYHDTNRLKEAEPLMKRALKIDEASLGKDHPDVAGDLNNLAVLYKATNRLKEAEPLMERHLVILLQFTRRTGHPHPHLQDAINNYTALLIRMGHTKDQALARLKRLAPEILESKDNHPNQQ